MRRLFCWLHGGHPSLPAAEVRGAIEGNGWSFRELEVHDCVIVFETDADPHRLAERLAFTRKICAHFWTCRAEEREILRAVSSSDLVDHMPASKSFAVRVRRIRRSAPRVDTVGLAKRIAETIKRGIDFRVDLEAPEQEVFAVLTGDRCVGGLTVAEPDLRAFAGRDPQRRPVFHPSTLPPRLARCMVNLARTPPGGLFLDPFCGVGGLLLEAALVGARVLGIDSDPRMVAGARRNLEWAGVAGAEVRVGDARRLSGIRADAVATDPPYGRQASTRGSRLEELYAEAVPVLVDALRPGGWACVSAPHWIDAGSEARAAGAEVVERHEQRVHGSLTRHIYVMRRR